MRSRQYNTIADLSVSLARICGLTSQGSEASEGSEGSEMKETLELAFPNFAYSVGLAGILQQSPDMSLLNHLTLENILDAEGAEDLEGPAHLCQTHACTSLLSRGCQAFVGGGGDFRNALQCRSFFSEAWPVICSILSHAFPIFPHTWAFLLVFNC